MNRIIDAHIHLDHYEKNDLEQLVHSLPSNGIDAVITVSFDLASCKKNLALTKQYNAVKSAFGYHPEQELPSNEELEQLFHWMNEHKDEMIAIGEVGLPYYLRAESKGLFALEPYVELLERFIKLAKKWDKPIVLHAVYDDAPFVCDLLEKHDVTKAHFHWFKGDMATIERMIQNGYYISLTPDLLYEQEIQSIASHYPLQQLMVETDGPWPFEGPFKGQMTHPKMIHQTVNALAEIKKYPINKTYQQLHENTKCFYRI